MHSLKTKLKSYDKKAARQIYFMLLIFISKHKIRIKVTVERR